VKLGGCSIQVLINKRQYETSYYIISFFILKRAGYEKFFQFISLRTTRSAISGVENMEVLTIGVGITVGIRVWISRGSDYIPEVPTLKNRNECNKWCRKHAHTHDWGAHNCWVKSMD
jgi:hypothetical protein